MNTIISASGKIFAGTSTQGVFCSDNNGVNWVQTNSGLGNVLLIQSLASKDNYLFAGTINGFFYSNNEGGNWINSTNGITQSNIRAVTTDDSGNIYAGCIFAGVFRSTNNGLNWIRFALGEGDLLFSLSIKDNIFLIGLEGGIYRSTNYGYNWSAYTNGLTDLSIRKLIQTGSNIYCGTDEGGIFVTQSNGTVWQPQNSGLTNLRIQALHSYEGNLFTAVAGEGIFHYRNSVNKWIQVNEGLSDTNFYSIWVNDNFIFAGSSTGKIWKRPLSDIITGIESHSENLTQDYILFQNYPNPFNPKTMISYKLAKRSFVTLKVHNILGKSVSTLVSETKHPGNHSTFFDGKDLPGGVYFLSLSAGDYTDIKIMTLIK